MNFPSIRIEDAIFSPNINVVDMCASRSTSVETKRNRSVVT